MKFRFHLFSINCIHAGKAEISFLLPCACPLVPIADPQVENDMQVGSLTWCIIRLAGRKERLGEGERGGGSQLVDAWYPWQCPCGIICVALHCPLWQHWICYPYHFTGVNHMANTKQGNSSHNAKCKPPHMGRAAGVIFLYNNRTWRSRLLH